MSRSDCSAGRTAWADVNIESDDDLNLPANIRDISSDGWGSGACTPTTESTFTQRLKEKKKIRNRPITRQEISNDSDSHTGESSIVVTTSESESQGTGRESPMPPPPEGSNGGPVEDEEIEREGQMSVGAALHEGGTCKPCLFRYTKLDCKNGYDCEFCHLSHKRGSRNRPCKGKRDRYKKLIARQDEMLSQSGSSSHSMSNPPDAGSQKGSQDNLPPLQHPSPSSHSSQGSQGSQGSWKKGSKKEANKGWRFSL